MTTETRLALAYKFKEFEAEKAKVRKASTQFKLENTDRSPVTYPYKEVEELDTESEKTHEEIIDLTEISLTSSEEELSPDDSSEGKTLEAVAKKAGVSYGTAFQSDAIQRKGTEEQKQAVSNGEASIKKVYTQIQKAERHENLKTANFPEGKYRVIYIY